MTAEIVIVDDDPTTADLIKRVLRRHPWQVQGFVDPLEALAWLSDETPRLLIVDTRMPKMDGPELLASLYDQQRLVGSQVLLVSAGAPVDTEWTRLLPDTVERIGKSAIYDRASLEQRLAALAAPADVVENPAAGGETLAGDQPTPATEPTRERTAA